MKIRGIVLIACVIFGATALYLANSTEKLTEVNAMTGEIRTRVKRAYIFSTEWKVTRTWVAESAERQGISTVNGWQYLGTLSENPFYCSRGCGRAPASYPLRSVSPEFFDLTSTDEIDEFAREFIAADEARRIQMLATP